MPQTEQVFDDGNHLSICTTVLPVLSAICFSFMKSEKPRSLIFLPHSLCIAWIISVSKHSVSYCLQRWWASHQWNASRWSTTRLCTLARWILALWRLLLPFCFRDNARSLADISCVAFEKLRRLYLRAIWCRQVCLQAEIKTCGFTSLGNVQLETFCLSNNTQPQIAYSVTDDCDRFNIFYIKCSAFVIPEYTLGFSSMPKPICILLPPINS